MHTEAPAVETLFGAGHDTRFPRSIELIVEGRVGALTLVRSLRTLPGKRLVAEALWDGEPVLAKCFLARAKAKHCERERRGIRALTDAGVPTPPVLAHGRVTDGSAEVLLIRYLGDAEPLKARWQRVDEAERLRLLKQAAALLARLHDGGWRQTDAHPGNFLLDGDRMVMIDGATVRALPQPAWWRRASDVFNLGALLAELYPRYDRWLEEVYAAYREERREGRRLPPLASLRRAVRSERRRKANRDLRKCFRTCAEVVAEHTWRRRVLCRRDALTPAMRALLTDPDACFGPEAVWLKKGRTSSVVRVEVDGRFVVIKRSNLKTWRHRLRKAVQVTRAARSWHGAFWLRLIGVPTARPIALVERRWGPLRGVSYLVAEHVDGEDAVRHWRGADPGTLAADPCLQQVAGIFEDLRITRTTHGDLKATNLLITATGPVLIDLDRVCRHRLGVTFRRAWRRDCARFLRNWASAPDMEAAMRDLAVDSSHRA